MPYNDIFNLPRVRLLRNAINLQVSGIIQYMNVFECSELNNEYRDEFQCRRDLWIMLILILSLRSEQKCINMNGM